jgi:hypothetical protein
MSDSVLGSLSPSELSTVQNAQLSVDDLPTYYNNALDTDVPISRDFEAFLILAPSSLKTSALTWIQNAVGLNKSNQLRDDLSAITITQELANANLKINEYNTQLNGFQAFRTSFQTSTNFAGIPEVQLFLYDLQSVIDELVLGQDRAFFDQTIALVMQKYGDSNSVTDGQVEELQSWTGVISTYLSG